VSAESFPEPPVQSPSVARLLKAASPAVSEELDKLLREFREQLEAEATVRLKKALLDREGELRKESELAQERMKAETTTLVTNQVTAQLEERFKSRLTAELKALEEHLRQEAQRSRTEMQEQTDQARLEWRRVRTELIEESEGWRVLAQFHQRVGEASSQSEILKKFLRAAERFSRGAALYLNKPDGLALWSTVGDGGLFPEVISEDTKDPQWFWAPIVIRETTVAVLCASEVPDTERLTALIDGLRRAIEYLGLRMQVLGSPAPLAASNGQASRTPGPTGLEPPSDPFSEAGADARRLARTLVSGIKLGHEREVLEGRARFDLYARLQKQIDEGRRSYLRQLPTPAPSQDFFHDEVVKILAGNDPGCLGEGYPGPR
jgi:hypothetical protein